MTPLVLLHAFPLDATMYDDVRGLLVDDWEVVAPNLPGFGTEPVSTEPPSLDVVADFVATRLDALGHERVILAGTSMGGYVAMAFARRHGERLAGLALVDTKAGPDPDAAAAGRRDMADRLLAEQTITPLVEAVFPKLLGSTTTRDRADVVDRVRTLLDRCDPTGAAWAQRAMAARPDSFETLRRVHVPAVVVVGSEDQLVSDAEARALADALPDSSLVVVPDTGHLSPVEAPEAVASALSQLRARVEG